MLNFGFAFIRKKAAVREAGHETKWWEGEKINACKVLIYVTQYQAFLITNLSTSYHRRPQWTTDTTHDLKSGVRGEKRSFIETLKINAAFCTVRARQLLPTVIYSKIEEDSTSSLCTCCINYWMSLIGLPRTVQIPATVSWYTGQSMTG